MLLRKLTVLLSVLAMMLVMSVPPAMADPGFNRGNKGEDGLDANQGGGQEKIPNPHPPRGGENHDDNGGGNEYP
jgi:hypothetical protein